MLATSSAGGPKGLNSNNFMWFMKDNSLKLDRNEQAKKIINLHLHSMSQIGHKNEQMNKSSQYPKLFSPNLIFHSSWSNRETIIKPKTMKLS